MVDLKLLVNNLHPSSESSRLRQDLRLLSATLSRNSVLLIFFVNYNNLVLHAWGMTAHYGES